jgi:7,8-dihydropterin-6-yl-methyl-4-(beta-D-ribofuranosyl)aminobenzene 5'-phosphate synthase
MKGDSYYPDRLADDLALGIETSSGLIVIAGCAHRGIINTIQQLIKVTGEQRLRAVMGAFTSTMPTSYR